MARRGDRAQRAERLAVPQAHVGALVARGRHRHAARARGAARRRPRRGRGGRGSGRCRRSRRGRARRLSTRSRCACASGPGSTTKHGSRPTSHVFVPAQREGARVVGGDEPDVVHQGPGEPDRATRSDTRAAAHPWDHGQRAADRPPQRARLQRSSTSTAHRPRCTSAGRSCVEGRAPVARRRCAATSRARLEHVPRFRRRVARPRCGLGDPHWADDAGFDIARHVARRHAGAARRPGASCASWPGSAAVARRSTPPTRCGGCTSSAGCAAAAGRVVGQAHHALVDGIAAVEVAMLLFDAAGHAPAPSTPARWAPRPPAVGAAPRWRRFARGRAGGRRARRARRDGAPTVGHGGDLPRRRAPARGAGAGRPRWTARPRTARAVGLRGHVARGRARGRPPPRRDDQRRPARRRHARPRPRAAPPRRAPGRGQGRSCRSTCAAAARRPAMGNRISFVTVELPVAVTDPIDVLRRVRARDARRARRAAAPRRWRRCPRWPSCCPARARRVVARTRRARGVVQRRRLQRARPAGRARPARAPRQRDLPRRAVAATATRCRSARCPTAAGCTAASTPTPRWCPTRVDVARDLEAAFDALRASSRAAADTPWRARARVRAVSARAKR